MGARVTELHRPRYEIHMGPVRHRETFIDYDTAMDTAEQLARTNRIVTVVKVHGNRRPVIMATWTDGERD